MKSNKKIVVSLHIRRLIAGAVSKPRILLLAFCLFAGTPQLRASWFGEISGLDFDFSRGRLSVKPPNLAAVPEMIRNLPKDVGQALLNPAGNALAAAIRFSRGQALNRGPQSIPPRVRQDLAPYFPPSTLDGARWTLKGNGITLDAILGNWFNQEGAVTLDEVIVFSSTQLANDVALWAHELTHVLQYSQLGVESFAFQYSFNFNQFEDQARSNATRIVASINASQSGQARTWGYEGEPATAATRPTWQAMNRAARQTINPVECIWINNQTNTAGNVCPVPIRVTGVVVRRLFDGYTFAIPCNEQTCIVGPNQGGPLISPPAHLVVGITAAYQL